MSRKHPGSRHDAALDPRRWERARRAAFNRDGYRCQECGQAGRLECHHVKPLEAGGAPYALGNLATLCRACHIDRHKAPDRPEQAAWARLVAELS